jgi:hypothetical protein
MKFWDNLLLYFVFSCIRQEQHGVSDTNDFNFQVFK